MHSTINRKEEITTSSVPRHAYRARRRKRGDFIALIYQNRYYRIDPMMDEIWRSCDCKTPLWKIAENLAASANLSVSDALSITIGNIVWLSDERLIEWSDV